LSRSNAPARGGTQLPSRCRGFLGRYRLYVASVHHLPDLLNPGIDLLLLRLEAFYRGCEYF
jgi:hypothetical protein